MQRPGGAKFGDGCESLFWPVPFNPDWLGFSASHLIRRKPTFISLSLTRIPYIYLRTLGQRLGPYFH